MTSNYCLLTKQILHARHWHHDDFFFFVLKIYTLSTHFAKKLMIIYVLHVNINKAKQMNIPMIYNNKIHGIENLY